MFEAMSKQRTPVDKNNYNNRKERERGVRERETEPSQRITDNKIQWYQWNNLAREQNQI